MYYSEKHNLYFVKKRVKNFTLRMRNDGVALCTVPMRISLEHAEDFVDKHSDWLSKQRKKLANIAEKNVLKEDEILFRGLGYRHIYNADLGTMTLFDHELKIIRTARNITDNKEKEQWYIEQALSIIPPKVEHLAKQFGFEYRRITIRNQRTKWGSCSAHKNLNFNYKLVQMPDYVLDYIIVHELVHTEFLNHGEQFWQKVELCFPDYKKAEKYLRKEARLL